jgi:hypothetical protein
VIIEKHDIQVEGSRLPPVRAHATGVGLDAMEPSEQVSGVERRFDGEHLVQVGRLGEPAQRGRLFDCGRSDHTTLRKGIDGVSRARQVCVTVAKVRSERDVRDLAHRAERRNRRQRCQFMLASTAGSVRAVYRHARDPSGQIAQVRGDLAELVRGALELAKRASLVRCRPRHGLSPFAVAA